MSNYADANIIIGWETKAAQAMGSAGPVRIPQPDGKTQTALESRGVVFGNKVDRVLVEATLPAGWTLKGTNPRDERHRAIFDDSGNKVCYVFLKNSGYDYYGHTSMC